MGLTPPSGLDEIARAFENPDALRALARRHREQARPDFDRIHPTWMARSLREESPAVRSIVAAYGPVDVGSILREGGELPRPGTPPHPEILEWVLALWSERLVGGSPRDDDPPVIVALTRTSPREAYRLWRTVGIVKSALAMEDPARWVTTRLGTPTPGVRVWAARDVEAAEGSGVSGRRGTALLGLITAFRLLRDCDPFTGRWAVQTLPYPIVLRARGLALSASEKAPSAQKLEGLILQAAWERLVAQGRMATPHPGPSKEMA